MLSDRMGVANIKSKSIRGDMIQFRFQIIKDLRITQPDFTFNIEIKSVIPCFILMITVIFYITISNHDRPFHASFKV